MEYDEGTMGRIFTLRLGDGDRLPDTVEVFAQAKRIRNALVFYLGGAADGSRMVVGPEENRGDAVVPMLHTLRGAQEVLAVGTLFPNESGEPVLHMHAAAGREGGAVVGCTRAGVHVWLVGEVVVLEVLGVHGVRKVDPATGFQLLRLGEGAKG